MPDRPEYETKGGVLSEGETFARAMENLRLVIKDIYMLGHIANIHNRSDRGEGFIRIAQFMEQVRIKLTQFTTTGRMN